MGGADILASLFVQPRIGTWDHADKNISAPTDPRQIANAHRHKAGENCLLTVGLAFAMGGHMLCEPGNRYPSPAQRPVRAGDQEANSYHVMQQVQPKILDEAPAVG